MQRKRRVFIAINLPGDIKKYLSNFNKKWQDLPAKWTNQENLHITLVFLGYLSDEEVGEVCMAVKDISSQYESFNISLNKVLYGPDEKSLPKYVWIEGEKSKEISSLKRDIENKLSEVLNFKPEKRSFNLHITLARIKTFEFRTIEIEERPEVNEDINLSFTVESIEVMESELSKKGPVYSIIESFNLGS